MKTKALILLFAGAQVLPAQVFGPDDSAGGGQPAQTGNTTTIVNREQPAPQKQLAGGDVPFLDPGSEVASWDGHSWNIGNNRLFRARFEKYLAAPEENSEADKIYRQTLIDIMDAMSPNRQGGPSLATAVQLLPAAAKHPIDARVCDSIAQAVYGVVRFKKHIRKLEEVNKALEKEAHNQAWNFEVANDAAATRAKMDKPAGKGGGAGGPAGGQARTDTNNAATDSSRTARYVKKIVEIDAQKVANAAKISVGELKAKVEFQALIVQFFLQRRFEHCIIASRMYRQLFEDGDTELKFEKGSDVEKTFVRTTGVTPTISGLDALSLEMIRDVDEGVQAFEYYVDKDELDSGSKRLGEAFMMGEYLPRMRTLPRSKKAKVIEFVRDTNQLLSAIEVKDYTLVEELTEKLRKTAKDFDYSKPRAAVEVARAQSSLHIQQARSAAIAKNDEKVAEQVRLAALVWPTNPDLKSFTGQMSNYSDMHQRILSEFDSLYAKKDFREIYRESLKYSGAILGRQDYQKKLEEVVLKIGSVEKAVQTSDIMAQRGDISGAWEQLDIMSKDFPDDSEVNKRLKDLAPKTPEFAQAITKAKELEDKQLGVSLSWYLRARKLYPGSIYAKEGIDRLKKRMTNSSAAVTTASATGTP